jgi:penicillin-binding protein 1B
MTRRRILAVVAVALVGVVAELLWLEHRVEARFRDRLGEVSSQVYARPLRLAPGTDIERVGLLERLERLGYREVRSSKVRPGEVHRGRGSVTIGRRGFRSGRAGPVRLRVSYGEIRGITDAQGRALSETELEPERIADVLGEQASRRRPVLLADLPAHLLDAILTVEDQHFYDHAGLDLWRMGGAFIANLEARRIVQGGSTITQQFVKNFYLSSERTFSRKLREIVIALILESNHTKDEIFEAYLNHIYMGQEGSVAIQGVGAAARHYFGKDAKDLDLAESALLAAIIPAPGNFSPFEDSDAALERRRLVLDLLQSRGRITDEAHGLAVKRPIGVVQPRRREALAPYFVAHLLGELDPKLEGLSLDREGLAIVSTLDADLQRIARRAVRGGVERLERDVPGLERPEGRLQGALVALDAETGEVLALVGGREFGESQFNRATQARRQPGSAFKPIVALAALSRNGTGPSFTLASMLDDEELVLGTDDEEEEDWTPANFDGEFRGRVTLRDAIEQSLNVPIARLGLEVGPRRIAATGRRLGIESPLRAVPSLSLGSSEVTLLELTRAYAVLASGGRLPEVRSYREVLDRSGQVLERSEPSAREVFRPEETYLVTSALRGVVERGTGRPLRAWGLRAPVAGKTGTTNDFRDGWFIGYTPDLVAGVWVGFDDGTSLGIPAAAAALPVFAEFMKGAIARRGEEPFEPPPGVERVRIHSDTGLRARLGCWGPPEVFLSGSAPSRFCDRGLAGASVDPFRWLADRIIEIDRTLREATRPPVGSGPVDWGD